tara:strand:+ start:162 stop:416 length:255 start_codon:yes stop_codon:yes gene_type:complete
MNDEAMYKKLAARIMSAKNREAVSVLVGDLSAKDIIVLKEQYGVVLSAGEDDQALLKEFQITRRKIEKIEKKAVHKKGSSDPKQ